MQPPPSSWQHVYRGRRLSKEPVNCASAFQKESNSSPCVASLVRSPFCLLLRPPTATPLAWVTCSHLYLHWSGPSPAHRVGSRNPQTEPCQASRRSMRANRIAFQLGHVSSLPGHVTICASRTLGLGAISRAQVSCCCSRSCFSSFHAPCDPPVLFCACPHVACRRWLTPLYPMADSPQFWQRQTSPQSSQTPLELAA